MHLKGDLHFECNGQVRNTQSHDELHIHGVHFLKKGDHILFWMDMIENAELAFETRYERRRRDSNN